MLDRMVYLAVIWFAISLTATILVGARLKRSAIGISIGWLLFVLAVGDGIALATFGQPEEILPFSILAVAAGLVFISRLPDWNAFGQVSWLVSLLAIPLFLVYVFSLTTRESLSPAAFLIAMSFFFLQLIASLVALTHMYENLDVTCRVRWNRIYQNPIPKPAVHSMVSLHLPAFDEPPEVVAATLRKLAMLDYPEYEVLVVDNNTPDEKSWRPIETLCRELGPRFRFFHLDNWPGYKSGALNFALAQTSPRAELVGVVDADYQVEPHFLRALVPAFADPELAFIQSPQDYRDFRSGSYSEAIYYGYKYFFEVPMPVRNERNAIIFAGTMGLIRKKILQEIGGWSEWCITEDAETSMRVLKRGYRAAYYPKSLGRGLMPCNFAGLKRQRFRWCFGNIQILRRHWESMMPWAHWIEPANKLTAAQRYFFFTGCVQWFTDAFNFAFVIFLLGGGILNLLAPTFSLLPVTESLIGMVFVFLLLNLWRLGWVIRQAMHISWRLAFLSMYGMFSVGWVVALASFRALLQPRTAFLRTPKVTSDARLVNALFTTQWEAGIGLACLVIAAAVFGFGAHSLNAYFIGGVLLWQSTVYLAAPVYSMFYKSCDG